MFSTTHTGKGQKNQIFLSGRIYYSFVTSTKSEGRCEEYLRHVMMKTRI